MNMDKQTIVVTGVSSFIGFHVSRYLSQRNFQVLGTISQDISNYSGIRKIRLQKTEAAGTQLRLLDFSDETALRCFIDHERPAVWIHHAGWTKDYGNLEYNLEKGHSVNVSPLTSIYSLLKEFNGQGVIITGSSWEYSDFSCVNKESDPCWPSTPYGLSKLSETIRAYQLAHQYRLRTRVARVFLPYGPFDAPEKLFPSAIAALRSGSSIPLTSCDQERDLIYIDDLSSGYLSLLNDLKRNTLFDLFNFCAGTPIPLKAVLLTMAELLNADPALLQFGKRPMRQGDAQVFCGSNQKALSILKWYPRSFQEGIKLYLRDITS